MASISNSEESFPSTYIVRHEDCVMLMNSKEKAILDRIKLLEDGMAKGREFLEFGKHADWNGFRPLFAKKVRDDKVLPPHKDWIKNLFIPRHERALRKAHKSLERVTLESRRLANQSVEAAADPPRS